MTTLFYAPPDRFQSGVVSLPEDESRHAAVVLRHRPGDEIDVVDGFGGWHRIILTEVSPGGVKGQVRETRQDVNEPPYRLRLALAPLKSPARYEVFVEKAVELGVSAITPISTERTEKSYRRGDRLQRIAIAAMKQCRRSRLLQIGGEETWNELLRGGTETLRLVCHEAAIAPETIVGRMRSDGLAGGVLIAVGPEGGFSEREIDAALAANFAAVSLGPRRLRAETAAITAAAAVMLYAQT